MRTPKRFIFSLLFIAFAINLYAGKISRAYKALAIYDYFKARNLFQKAIKHKHNMLTASYGISTISSHNDNHFYNIDTAYVYVLKAQKAYRASSPKQKISWKKDYKIDSISIAGLLDTIEQKAFIQSTVKNTVDGYNHFIDTYTAAKQVADAIELRNLLAFSIDSKENTYQAYKSFMDTYPNSTEFDEAKKRYEILLFKTLTADHKVSSYTTFIAQYPQSPYVSSADDSVYRMVTPHRFIKEYYSFIRAFPSNHNVDNAWHKIYSLYTMDAKSETFVHFHKDYPDYPFTQHADSDLVLSQLHFYPAREGNLWGYIDSAGKVRVPFKYEWVDTNFYDGLASVALNDKLGFINKRGELVIPCIYDEADHFHSTLSVVKKGNMCGIISSLHQTIVPFEYQEISNFSEGMAVIEKNNKFGYISLLGEEVVPAKYQDAGDFAEGFASVQNTEGKYGFINHSRPISYRMQI